MTDSRPGTDEGGSERRTDAASPRQVDAVAAEHRDAGRRFARITVVRREPPVSANVGDRAVVTPDGDLTGWIGGAACAQSVAIKEARAALEEGVPRLVGLAPDPEDVARPGLEAYPMTCHSGGTLELFVEPVTPSPRLVVVGTSPVAQALVRLAAETRFAVSVVTGQNTDPTATDYPGADDAVAVDAEGVVAAVEDAAAVVVASMGEYDVAGLDAALRTNVPYVGLVASDVRRDELAADVAARLDTDPETVVASVTTPAGLDIGAKTPPEIAVSILAELVAVRRGVTDGIDVAVANATTVDAEPTGTVASPQNDTQTAGPSDTDASDAHAEPAVDPVCGMDVAVGAAAESVMHEGETYYFCGEGCATAFRENPDGYTDTEVVAGG